ncbi:diacylglycerol kinase family protein [Pelagicoccus sp. SDUM812002]|uniref:diacylglycerol kinase family protein n=1 Tax=Pelagicoccus sp. SDUM812002 TaxID=3041266 RepID=UPI00281049AC|nr:diacylglycerol kinase family protein [Pelagicoccus sp. SDUM812002]MDQ8187136.1 diacylglycerol kinase family protein [Pelagicoccus sp. SDUM812002]
MKPFDSFGHAFRGIRDFIACGTNSKIQAGGAFLIFITGIVLGFSTNDWIAIVICTGFVLSAEAMNTAVEELANEVTEERKERIRKVKDMAAGSVLISSLASVVVAVLIVFRNL